MTDNKTKRFKWQKIALVTLSLVFVLSLTCSAVYTSGDAQTPRYYAPLRFDFEIFGTTAQLTPTISYKYGESLTYDTFEQATQMNDVISSINRTNFGVSLVGNTAVDISYRLKFNVTESVDNFTIKIVAPSGMYDFDKYGIPQINVPTGYDVDVRTTYNYRFTQKQSYTDSVGHYTQKHYTARQGDNITLLYDTVDVNGVTYDVVGGVLVTSYVTTLEFNKRGSSGTYGDSGYYLWDTVISLTGYQFEDTLGNGPQLLECDGVRVIGSTNGVVDTIDVNAFYFTEDLNDTLSMYYELDPDATCLVYDFINGTWHGATRDDDGIDIDEITPEQMRLLVFDTSTSEAFNLATLESGTTAEQYQAYKIRWFLDFLYGESTYYPENPLTMTLNSDGTTYSFTDGDGGMYLHYYADRMLSNEYGDTLSDWYQLGYNQGFGGGGEFNRDYTTWLSTAVGGFLDFELFPNFTLGGVLGVLVALGLLIMFLKFFAGG